MNNLIYNYFLVEIISALEGANFNGTFQYIKWEKIGKKFFPALRNCIQKTPWKFLLRPTGVKVGHRWVFYLLESLYSFREKKQSFNRIVRIELLLVFDKVSWKTNIQNHLITN